MFLLIQAVSLTSVQKQNWIMPYNGEHSYPTTKGRNLIGIRKLYGLAFFSSIQKVGD
jgi:hypothetical protein